MSSRKRIPLLDIVSIGYEMTRKKKIQTEKYPIPKYLFFPRVISGFFPL